jgi:hypothetical protein
MDSSAIAIIAGSFSAHGKGVANVGVRGDRGERRNAGRATSVYLIDKPCAVPELDAQ